MFSDRELERIADGLEATPANGNFIFAQMNAARGFRQLMHERDLARTAVTHYLLDEIKRMEAIRDELRLKLAK